MSEHRRRNTPLSAAVVIQYIHAQLHPPGRPSLLHLRFLFRPKKDVWLCVAARGPAPSAGLGGLVPVGRHVSGDALADLVAVVEIGQAVASGLSARQSVTAGQRGERNKKRSTGRKMEGGRKRREVNIPKDLETACERR